MSKNFEREYREYLNAQAPDLWSRIEEGIAVSGTAPVMPIADAGKKPISKMKRNKRVRYYRLIASVAACVVALCLVVPVYRFVRKDTTDEKNMATTEEMVLTDATITNTVEAEDGAAPASDGYGQPTAGVGVPEEAVPAAEEAAVEEVVMEAESEGGETSLQQNATSHEYTAMATDGGSEGNMGLVSDEKGESQSLFEGSQEEMAAGTEEQLNVEVTILAEEKRTEEGIVYEAVVADSAVKELNINETVRILLPDVLGMALKEETAYVVILQQGTSDADYTVVSVTATE